MRYLYFQSSLLYYKITMHSQEICFANCVAFCNNTTNRWPHVELPMSAF